MAYLTGDQASFTYGTGAAITVADGIRWEGEIGRRVARTTPFGYAMERVTLSQRLYARGRLTLLVNGTNAPPLPNTVTGDLVLLDAAGHSYAFKALLTRMTQAPDSVAATEQTANYEFENAATNSTDTIVVTG